MKRFAQIFGVLVALVLLCAAGLIVSSEVSRARSTREIGEIVAKLTPGTSFSDVTQRLGRPTQMFTNNDEIRVFGTSRESSINTNSILYAFSHHGPPIRWIIVYTDPQSLRVLHAAWKDL